MIASGTKGTAELTLPADDQIRVTRTFAAPRELVWRTLTEPELVRRWWGAERGTMTECEIDARVGGAWRFLMEAEGVTVGFHGEFRELERPSRIVQTEVYDTGPGANPPETATVNTMTLTERDGVTEIEVLIQCPSREVRDGIVASGMEGGLQESYDALEQVAISLT